MGDLLLHAKAFLLGFWRMKKGSEVMVESVETSQPQEEEVVEIGNHEGEEEKEPDSDDASQPQEEEKVAPRSGKRKRSMKKETTTPRAKRSRKSKAHHEEEEAEYFVAKRSFEDLWKAAFPVGTEWDQLDSLYQFNWDFKNLEEALEEGGELHGKKVFVFGCSEPQIVPYKDKVMIVNVPAVVVIDSPFPPSDKIGITSVQREREEIVPMKKMKMDWLPYIPFDKRDRLMKNSSQIFILGCTQRRCALRHLKEDQVKKFTYCLPYFYHPFKEDEELEESSTEVQIMFPSEKAVVCSYDWKKDGNLGEFVKTMIKKKALPAEVKDEFTRFVREQCRAAITEKEEAKEARMKAIEEMSQDHKEAFQNMKLYKFYPQPSPDTPDVSAVKAPFINRYYGKAHQVL